MSTIHSFVGLIALFFILISCQRSENQAINWSNINQMHTYQEDKSTNRKVDSLLAKMSLEEKVAQLHGVFLHHVIKDNKLDIAACKTRIPNGVGHAAQFASPFDMEPAQLREIIKQLNAYNASVSSNKIPILFAEEAITGFSGKAAATYPQQIGMACTWNPALIRINADQTRQQMRALGAAQVLSPMMDICRNSHWGRMEESFGEEPYLTARMGLAFVRGIQGNSLKMGVAATTKHFAGYGGNEETLPSFYQETLMPHEVNIRLGGAQTVMAGYHKIHGIPCSASKELLTDILRDQWDFRGMTVSDFWSVKQVFTRYKYAENDMDAGIKSLEAGLDVELPFGMSYPLLLKAVEENKIDLATINNAVKNVLRLKFKLGLFQKKDPLITNDSLNFDTKTQRANAYQSAAESIVLLKNNGILPIKNSVKKIAFVGPNANAVQSLLGDYTYQSLSAYWWKLPIQPNNPKLITLLEGLKQRNNNRFEINYERGCDWEKSLGSETKNNDGTLGDERVKDLELLDIKGLPIPNVENAIKISQDSDLIIAAMGEHLYLSGENRDRENIHLPGAQEAFVKKLLETGKPVVLVLFGGRPQVITNLETQLAAILHAWFPGEEGGLALADILLGKVNPSGKLTVSYPKKNSQKTLWYANGYEGKNEPLYPFGYGLSYTDFTIENIQIDTDNSLENPLIISVDIRNTGNMDGKEIIQLYAHSKKNTAWSNFKKRLIGFQKIALAKNQISTVYFKVFPEQLSYFNESLQRIIESGNYEFQIGNSSVDIQVKAEVELKGERKILETKTKFFSETAIVD